MVNLVSPWGFTNILFCLGLEEDLLSLAKNDPLGRRLQDAGLTHTTQRVPKRAGLIMKDTQKSILVYADWFGIESPQLMGTLMLHFSRAKEIFSSSMIRLGWNPYAQILDPHLSLFSGLQYAREGRNNFGLFLDSSPDRWGRILMQRREAAQARIEKRAALKLTESDYLLGVYDGHRMGALRFKLSKEAPFLDDQKDMAAPPWTKLRDLESISLKLEKEGANEDKDYLLWLKMLIAPGTSLGGARPKASVLR